MAFRLELGQYWAADSPIHALDARAKLLCLLALMVGFFSVGNAAQLVACVALVAALLALSRVPPVRVLASVRPLVLMLAVLSLFNLFFVQTGEVVLAVGPVTITTGGLWAAVLYTVRFACAIVAGSLILLTTTPMELSDAFDRMLAPLSRVGLPGHEIAMVLSLVLRFIPVLADETSAILDAQAMRGGGFDEGGVVERVRAVVPVVVALLASGLRHADGLSRALDARCYEGGAGRTYLHEPRLGRVDALAAAVTVAFLALLVLLV